LIKLNTFLQTWKLCESVSKDKNVKIDPVKQPKNVAAEVSDQMVDNFVTAFSSKRRLV